MSDVPIKLHGDSPSFSIEISNKNAKTICVLVTKVATAADSHSCNPWFVNNCPMNPKIPKVRNTKSC